ncbi:MULTISPECIES: hypothetical protein [Streptomyces]|uniref:Uncharacterized protein n=2 Tax=Streptomyces TaxID=1883 RepID=A0ABU4K0H9_9ACTN|nr:hypothetical protein [Streptomyces roseolus]MDX2290980.1 hypothetical protein [Streptomyces roseolus]
MLVAPAYATPGGGIVAADAAGTDADLIHYPEDGELLGAGVTGFLTRSVDGQSVFRRYADGSGQAYDYGAELSSTRTSDFVVVWEPETVTQHDLSTNSTLEVAIGDAAGDPRFAGAAGDAVFTALTTEAGTVLRRHTPPRTPTVSPSPDFPQARPPSRSCRARPTTASSPSSRAARTADRLQPQHQGRR